jgi:hypothetical protein
MYTYCVRGASGERSLEERGFFLARGRPPCVDSAKAFIGKKMTAAMRRHLDEARGTFRDREKTLSTYKTDPTLLHRALGRAGAKPQAFYRSGWAAAGSDVLVFWIAFWVLKAALSLRKPGYHEL